jgi:molybdopterin-guanine dinucleotide biosynthesis protein A
MKRRAPVIEACILAGGLSARMGRDKARLRIGGRTLLAHVRATLRKCGLPTRVIRRDIVARCGPLGGIYTALATTRAEAVLFLACDMPFVSSGLIDRIIRRSRAGKMAAFAATGRLCGFPFLLPRESIKTVESVRRARNYSLQWLARATRAKRVRAKETELFNVNTRDDFARARIRFSNANVLSS